jgi:hypothetical protein
MYLILQLIFWRFYLQALYSKVLSKLNSIFIVKFDYLCILINLFSKYLYFVTSRKTIKN